MKLRLTKKDILSLPKEKQDALRELWELKKFLFQTLKEVL